MVQSGYDMNGLYHEAQHRWLKPAEVLYILQNHENYQITQEPPLLPPGGSLFLFNKRVLRFFRRDGHNWRKKKDQRTVGEAHERLKVGNVETLNCYYAHGEQNPNFQRRSYWMLDPAYEHIVLVHYRDINEGKSRSGSTTASSAFTPSPSHSPYSTQNQGSASITTEVNGSHQNHSSPGSVEVTSETIFKNNLIDHLGSSVSGEELSDSHNLEVSNALKRIEEQLSLNDEAIKELEPFVVENEHSNSTGFLDYETEIPKDVQYDNLVDGQEYSVNYQISDEWSRVPDDLSNYVALQDMDDTGGYAVGEEELWTEMIESYSKPVSSSWSKPQERQDYLWSDSSNKGRSCGYTNIPDNYPFKMEILGTNIEDYSHLFDQIPLAMPSESSNLIMAQVQKYSIKEISPQWGYSNEATKVIIVGSFLCDPSKFSWTCMFGDVEVPLEIVQEGVLCCEAPLHSPGKVTLCITSGNREACSEIREFDYRGKSDICSRCKSSPSETPGSTEELLLLVRFVQMLLCDSLLQREDECSSEVTLPKDPKPGDDSCSHIIETLLDGSGTSSEAINGLLQVLLKDKLQQWLAIRCKGNDQLSCSLSKKEQGVVHMIAALGFEWALSPILGCGVSINFRDINGWTALHWAARFGREKMVAGLIASGASAGAVTDPSAQDPNGKTAAAIAASNGHNGLAGYLSELALTSHLSSLTLEECELSRGSAVVEAERTIHNVTRTHSIIDDQDSLKDTLTAVRNAAQAAARIQSAFRAHSFRKRQQREAIIGIHDEYGISFDDLQAMSKLTSRHTREYNSAALSIQKKYRGWKGRKDFLSLRQKVVKIQAHVRGYQVRKQYKVFCWAVGVLDKVVLRWRRKGAGLRSLRHGNETSESTGSSEEDEDILKVFRKQKVDGAIEEAVSRVLSMVDSSDARQQYQRMLEKYRQAKAELDNTTGEATPSNSSYAVDMVDDGCRYPFQ